MNKRTMEQAFNEWMRRYIDEPDAYKGQVSQVMDFLKSENDGVEPDYGAWCTAYLTGLMNDD